MGNRLPNAGLLELTSGWAGSAGLSLSADEINRGAAGRCALKGLGSTTSAGQTVKVWVDSARRPAITTGTVEVSGWAAAFIAGVAVDPVVAVVFRNSSGTQTGQTLLAAQPAALSLYGEAKEGLTATYRRFYARLPVPAGTATADIEVRVTTPAAAAVEIDLLKPFLDVVPTGQVNPLLWDPGIHIDTDLQRTPWPGMLRPFQDQARAEPQPGRVEFVGGAGRPSSRKIAIDPVRRFQGTMRCDPFQRSILEDFWREGPADFWFVEPDSDRLCIASRTADGAPKVVDSRGSTVMMDMSLWLETA